MCGGCACVHACVSVCVGVHVCVRVCVGVRVRTRLVMHNLHTYYTSGVCV